MARPIVQVGGAGSEGGSGVPAGTRRMPVGPWGECANIYARFPGKSGVVLHELVMSTYAAGQNANLPFFTETGQRTFERHETNKREITTVRCHLRDQLDQRMRFREGGRKRGREER